MSWYKRYPAWLYAEWQELQTNGNYRPAYTTFDETFLSAGHIRVRGNGAELHPVLIVYPESTPYQPPSVYLLKEVPSEETIQKLAKISPAQIEQEIKPLIRFLHRRHQGPSGSLCFIEMEDLHREQAENYRIRDIIKRVRDWLAGLRTGRLPTDSAEVEVFSHFANQDTKLTLLIPDTFFNASFQKGRFYFSRVSPSAFEQIQRVYIGVAFEGATKESIVMPLEDPEESHLFLGHKIPKKEDILHRSAAFKEDLENGTYLEGFWYDIDREPEPFTTGLELARYLGEGQQGVKALLEGELSQRLAHDQDLYIGFRFPSRSPDDRLFEWQFFRLFPTEQRKALIFASEAELIERLSIRKVEAIRGEYVDEQSYFKRNRGIYSRETLKDSGASLFGVGALGAEVADCLAKAGVGHLHMVDMDLLKAQNTVRHLCGIRMLYFPKPYAVAAKVMEHVQHFTEVSATFGNVFQAKVGDLFAQSNAVGVSTIANDNTEGYLNEIAVRERRTVFYARAIRGGKAARIFRVIPGRDACKTCLSLYYQDERSAFIRIEDDPDLPVIATECNNPIRPGSAADLKLIASLTAKIVLEYLQNPEIPFNHWIWSTEALPGLPASGEIPFILKRQFLAPHPNCPTCTQRVPVPILLSEQAKQQIVDELNKVTGIETGGILIGFETAKKEICVLEATGPGPKAIMTACRFERDVEYCQQRLKAASERFGVKGLYVGEWHFHPVGENHPSPLDIRSLHEIANQKNYATCQPVMIIARSDHQLAGTVHPIGSEYLATEITDIGHTEAVVRELLLRPA